MTETVSVNGGSGSGSGSPSSGASPSAGGGASSLIARLAVGFGRAEARGSTAALETKENPRAPRADSSKNVTFFGSRIRTGLGQSEVGVGDSPLARAGKRATARDIAGIQAPNHRPSHAHPSTKWPLSSTPPSPRASPPPRCVSNRRGPLARAPRARFRGGPRANIASRSPPANIQTSRAERI